MIAVLYTVKGEVTCPRSPTGIFKLLAVTPHCLSCQSPTPGQLGVWPVSLEPCLPWTRHERTFVRHALPPGILVYYPFQSHLLSLVTT